LVSRPTDCDQDEQAQEMIRACAEAGRDATVVGRKVDGWEGPSCSPAGRRYSHAGASAEGETGGARAKRRVPAAAGSTVLDRYVEARGI
jgi:succinyl-CoA synthetase alpha subunit